MSEQIYNEIGQRLKEELHSSAGKCLENLA